MATAVQIFAHRGVVADSVGRVRMAVGSADRSIVSHKRPLRKMTSQTEQQTNDNTTAVDGAWSIVIGKIRIDRF